MTEDEVGRALNHPEIMGEGRVGRICGGAHDGIFKEGYFVIVSRSAYPSPTFSSGHVGGMHDNPLLAGVARKGGHGHASNRASLSASVASAVVLLLLLSHCAAGLFRLNL